MVQQLAKQSPKISQEIFNIPEAPSFYDPELNKQPIKKDFPTINVKMLHTDQHPDLKNSRDSPMKKIEELSQYSPLRKHPTALMKLGTENKKQVSNQGPFFRADNKRLQTDHSKNTLHLKTGPISSSASKKMQDDISKSKLYPSYSTIISNPIIAPNTQQRK